MENNLKNADDARTYLIAELKKQLVGPQDGHFTDGIASFQFSPNSNLYSLFATLINSFFIS